VVSPFVTNQSDEEMNSENSWRQRVVEEEARTGRLVRPNSATQFFN
jgi:hypothetical protein